MKVGSALISAMTCCWCMGERVMVDPESALRMMSKAITVSGRDGERGVCRGDLNSSPSRAECDPSESSETESSLERGAQRSWVELAS
jgi:hypothetical protein